MISMTDGEVEMIDADIHVYEPTSMWEYVDKRFRARIKVVRMIDDPEWREGIYDLLIDDHPIPKWLIGDRAKRFTGIYEMMKKRFPPGSGFDAQQYYKDVTAMGFSQVVVYPTMFLWAPFVPNIGAEFANALCRAYNDWLYDFCASDRKMLRPVAAISLHSVEDSIAEVRRCAKRGFVGVFIRPNPVEGRPVGHPDYHPLYRVLEELQLPLGIHEGGVTYLPVLGEDRTKAQWGIHAMSHAFEQMAAMLSMFEYRVFDAFPKLHVLFLEAGSSLWVPYWLDRLDEEQEFAYRLQGALKMKPSEYFSRQCFATFEANDHYLHKAVECIGDRGFMMTGDYPHAETSYDKTRERMLGKGLTRESLERVCSLNAKVAYPLIA
jgi:predicted TIM-barrel fold metal-dependent hydrolase